MWLPVTDTQSKALSLCHSRGYIKDEGFFFRQRERKTESDTASLDARRHAGDVRYHRLWHGHRQAGRTMGGALQLQLQHRGLLPGVWPGRQGWAAQPLHPVLLTEGLLLNDCQLQPDVSLG